MAIVLGTAVLHTDSRYSSILYIATKRCMDADSERVGCEPTDSGIITHHTPQ